MKIMLTLTLAISMFFLQLQAGGVAETTSNEQTYLVLTNASIYTVDKQRTRVEAMVIDAEGIVAATGSNAEITAKFGPGIDLEGAMILPGFQDAHLHAVEAGITSQFCELSQFGSANQYLDELAECAEQRPDWSWVIGAGVNMAALLESVDYPIELADRAIPERPLLVLDDLGHGAWGNSQAMVQAGFDKITGSPPGGIFVRDEDGELVGIVLEGSAQVLIDAAQPQEEWLSVATQSFSHALAQFARHGITTISDAGGYWP
ncbi:MAG: amidohydrolase family protein, partial [Pseudomonadota bacterium]